MFVNSVKINYNNISSASTATTINIPINLSFQIVDQDELIRKEFVNVEVEKSINPIFDYEKIRLKPADNNDNLVQTITYRVNMLVNGSIPNETYYANLGFINDDIRLNKNYFSNSYLNLSFYDSDKASDQRLVNRIILYPYLTQEDLYPFNSNLGLAGRPLDVNELPVRFILNPFTTHNGNSEGYYLYEYKDEIPKTLYMRASYANAKDGKQTNLMTEGIPYTIDTLVNKLYTKYTLKTTTTGNFYVIDNSYSSNVSHDAQNNVIINLYQIQTL